MSISAQSVVRIRTHVGQTDNSLRVSGRRTILARTSHLHLYLRKWMRHKARECWLHRCQVHPQQEFTTLTDKILRHAHHTFKSRGNWWRCTRTNGNRAGIQKVYRGLSLTEKNIREKFGISWNCEPIEPLKKNRQPYPDSLKRNIIRS